MKNFEIKNAIEVRLVSYSTEREEFDVVCDDGRYGVIPRAEVSRREIHSSALEKMVGSTRSVLEIGNSNEKLIFSGKRFEEDVVAFVANQLDSGIRNVFSGTYTGHTDKIVFYNLADGVSCGVYINNICYSRLNSLHKYCFPQEIQLVVTAVNPAKGYIYGDTKASFGSTEAEAKHLDLKAGGLYRGVVSGSVHGDAIVSLAPNLCGLVTGNAPYGKQVEVICKGIDPNTRKIRLEINRVLSDCECVWQFDDFTSLSELTNCTWFDFDDFERTKLGPKKTAKQASVATSLATYQSKLTTNGDTGKPKAIFSSFPGETVWYPPARYSSVDHIIFETTHGYLGGEDQLKLVKLVGQHKYLTANLIWQARPELFQGDRKLLNKAIERLLKLGILGELRFKSSYGTGVARILFPGKFFHQFAGRVINRHYPSDFQNTAAEIKKHLAANQLLFNVLKWMPGMLSYQTFPLLIAPDCRLRPKAQIISSEGSFFIEAVRDGQLEDFIEKLGRYDRVLRAKKNEIAHPVILVAAEDEKAAVEVYERIQTLESFPEVFITHDLAVANSAEKPDFLVLAAKNKNNSGLFHRAFGLFGLI